ncbi:hypothetical protein Tco_0850954 [Tanacetum coccineum]
MLEKKISWIAWDKVLASKKKGGLGVSNEVQVLSQSGFDFLSYCSKRIGDGHSTSLVGKSFDRWIFPCVSVSAYCLPLILPSPNICVALDGWLAGNTSMIVGISPFLAVVNLVKDTRMAIDDLMLPPHSDPTRRLWHRVCRWWEIDFPALRFSFSEWDDWFLFYLRLPGQLKFFCEGVFYVALVVLFGSSESFYFRCY